MDAALCAVIRKMSYFPKEEETEPNQIFPFLIGDCVKWEPQQLELLIQRLKSGNAKPSDYSAYPLEGGVVIQTYPFRNQIRLIWLDKTTHMVRDKTLNADFFVLDYTFANEGKQAEASNFLAGSLRF